MPTSKVIWRNPEIDVKIKLENARQLYNSSVQSLKNQFLLSLFIIFAVYFNIFPKFVNINLQFYQFFWKMILLINLIFLCCYLYQLIQTTYTIFITTRGNKFIWILKDALFYLIPQLKIYYDKIVCSKFCSYFSRKTVNDEERIKAKEIEERRRLLTKSYFPSMFQHYGACYNEQLLNRSVDNIVGFNNQENVDPLLLMKTPENRFVRTAYTSTPFNNSADSVSFGGNITPILSPSRMGSRFSSGGFLSSPVRNENRHFLPEIPIGEVWNRLNINYNQLDNWTFSLKQWIHGTIITRVVAEIDNFNRRFIELGVNDVVIGRDSVQTLRHLESQLNKPYPSLKTLIDFLDCCRDQAYLVNRLKELSQGCSLGKFQYDSGSSSVQYPWKEYLPNDTILVLHMFCTYIEARFTTHSNLHGVRTFNQQFITDNLINKDTNELKDVFMLYQTSVQPPHFKVVFDQAIYDIPAGRKNLFHCLLIFFYKIYNNESNFKWLNLGRSGMNINFIFAQ